MLQLLAKPMAAMPHSLLTLPDLYTDYTLRENQSFTGYEEESNYNGNDNSPLDAPKPAKYKQDKVRMKKLHANPQLAITCMYMY